jgi:hypothetical protein
MALDFSMMHDDTPVASAHFQTDAHAEFIRIAKILKTPLLLRMADYYGDARYEVVELPRLNEELLLILRNLNPTYPQIQALRELVDHMRTIVEWSIEAGRVIEVLAD